MTTMKMTRWGGGLLMLVAAGCGTEARVDDVTTPTTSSRRVPLTDLGRGDYLGFPGGLYPGGNVMPTAHATAGLVRAVAIEPLDKEGHPSSRGRYVLLSIGMSNTTQEFCSQSSELPCDTWTFTGRAVADPEVNQTTLAIVNGAMGGRAAPYWDSPADRDYDRVRDTRLAPLGLAESQVQVVWLKLANMSPGVALPAPGADAFALETQLGNVVRSLKVRYPNLKQVFLSSRIYGGYATTNLNPEPYAYESGLAVKWLVEAQIRQMERGGQASEARAGDLNYDGVAPWIAWGPYLWADGMNPRSDGLIWERSDLAGDGTHPSRSGESKVATTLLGFFKTSAETRCWFLAGQTCP